MQRENGAMDIDIMVGHGLDINTSRSYKIWVIKVCCIIMRMQGHVKHTPFRQKTTPVMNSKKNILQANKRFNELVYTDVMLYSSREPANLDMTAIQIESEWRDKIMTSVPEQVDKK